jgi:hypothetical protein
VLHSLGFYTCHHHTIYKAVLISYNVFITEYTVVVLSWWEIYITLHRWDMNRDSSVGIALGYGLDDRGSRVRFPVEAGNFSLHHRLQNGSGAHPASYPMGTRGSFSGCKAAGAWSWPLTSIYCRGQRVRGAIPQHPQYAFIAWCLVKHSDNFNFTFTYTGGVETESHLSLKGLQ